MTFLIVVLFKYLKLLPSHHYENFKCNYLSLSLLYFKIYENRTESVFSLARFLIKTLAYEHGENLKSKLFRLFSIILDVFPSVNHNEEISHSLGPFLLISHGNSLFNVKICIHKMYPLLPFFHSDILNYIYFSFFSIFLHINPMI